MTYLSKACFCLSRFPYPYIVKKMSCPEMQTILSITKYHRFVPPLMFKADQRWVVSVTPLWRQGLEPAEVHAALCEASRGAASTKLRLSSLQVARHWTCEGTVATDGLNLGGNGKHMDNSWTIPKSEGEASTSRFVSGSS